MRCSYKKLKEIDEKDKTEELIQREKDLKERYQEIIMKYLFKQKQKGLIKKRENNRKYERSKIKVLYDDKPHTEDETETEMIIKVKEEEKDNTENELSILLEDEEIENTENLDNIIKLIYDNSYLYAHKKKDIVIKEEVLNILNQKPVFEIKPKKKEIIEDNKLSENQNTNNSNDNNNNNNSNNDISGDNNDENNDDNDNNNNDNNVDSINESIERRNNIRRKSSIKYFKKRRIKKKNKIMNKKKLSIFNDETEIKEEKEKESEITEENNEEILEKKLNDFFNKIQTLKNNTNLEDLDFLMNEELNDEYDTEKRTNGRRLNDFIEKISNNIDYERILRPKFNFLSPIKFSTKDMSNKSD